MECRFFSDSPKNTLILPWEVFGQYDRTNSSLVFLARLWLGNNLCWNIWLVTTVLGEYKYTPFLIIISQPHKLMDKRNNIQLKRSFMAFSRKAHYYLCSKFCSKFWVWPIPCSCVIVSVMGHLESHYLSVITKMSAPLSRRPDNFFFPFINMMSSGLWVPMGCSQ